MDKNEIAKKLVHWVTYFEKFPEDELTIYFSKAKDINEKKEFANDLCGICINLVDTPQSKIIFNALYYDFVYAK